MTDWVLITCDYCKREARVDTPDVDVAEYSAEAAGWRIVVVRENKFHQCPACWARALARPRGPA